MIAPMPGIARVRNIYQGRGHNVFKLANCSEECLGFGDAAAPFKFGQKPSATLGFSHRCFDCRKIEFLLLFRRDLRTHSRSLVPRADAAARYRYRHQNYYGNRLVNRLRQ